MACSLPHFSAAGGIRRDGDALHTPARLQELQVREESRVAH